MNESIISVSQLNKYLSFKFKEDFRLKSKLISGEISNFTHHSKTGHLFFTLKDKDSSIKAIMFRDYAERMKFNVENGMSVIVLASVEVFERDGLYQLYVKDIQPYGIGAQHLALEQLKQKLLDEGLFDETRKKPLPTYPKKIGVITAKSGAALQDIITTLGRRYPMGILVLFPVTVQGEVAADSVSEAIRTAQDTDCDVLIVARGGGSSEDLGCFNSEKVARAVADSEIPIISAVGHEVDTTLADYAADMRAPTPTAAAEIVAPDKNILYKMLQSSSDLLYNYTLRDIDAFGAKIDYAAKSLSAMAVDKKLELAEKTLKMREYRLNSLAADIVGAKCSELERNTAALEQLNPLAVLKRGYSVVYKDNKVVGSVKNLSDGDEIRIRLGDGEVSAKITKVGE